MNYPKLHGPYTEPEQLKEPAFRNRGQQPSQPAYLPDQDHGQGRIPTLPQPLTHTPDSIVIRQLGDI